MCNEEGKEKSASIFGMQNSTKTIISSGVRSLCAAAAAAFLLLFLILVPPSADAAPSDNGNNAEVQQVGRGVEGENDKRGGESDFDAAMRMPGTNFCGKGYSADNFSDLGAFGAADKCCRQHDLGCPAHILGLTANYGLYNWRMYTLMHCSCDARFRSCLKLTSSSNADNVGSMFFNIFQVPCFTFETVEVCAEWTWWGRCKRYEKKKGAVLRSAVPY